ncbi:hypothetical protein TNCV_2153761 [Trichonephila clavipes]|nr:hypothetical protein TNCV_2153761 [Trichonephila clavipes]
MKRITEYWVASIESLRSTELTGLFEFLPFFGHWTSPGSSTSASSIHSLNSTLHNYLRYRGIESDLRVSLVNNGLVGPYSATVLVTLSSDPDHRPPRLASARGIPSPSLTPGGCLDSALYRMFMWKFPTTLSHPHKQCPHCSRTKDLK